MSFKKWHFYNNIPYTLWPFIISVWVFCLFAVLVILINKYFIISECFSYYLLCICFTFFIDGVMHWVDDVREESICGRYTKKLRSALYIGFMLFLLCFLILFFYKFFYWIDGWDNSGDGDNITFFSILLRSNAFSNGSIYPEIVHSMKSIYPDITDSIDSMYAVDNKKNDVGDYSDYQLFFFLHVIMLYLYCGPETLESLVGVVGVLCDTTESIFTTFYDVCCYYYYGDTDSSSSSSSYSSSDSDSDSDYGSISSTDSEDKLRIVIEYLDREYELMKERPMYIETKPNELLKGNKGVIRNMIVSNSKVPWDIPWWDKNKKQ